jgi:hypothetical protein
MKESPNASQRISLFFFAATTVMLVISLIALYQVAVTYMRQGSLDLSNVLVGVSGIALSAYMLATMRRKPPKMGFEVQKVSATTQCTKCDFKSSRDFERGDYVLKEVGQCPKCNSPMTISSIYREATEEEKEK